MGIALPPQNTSTSTVGFSFFYSRGVNCEYAHSKQLISPDQGPSAAYFPSSGFSAEAEDKGVISKRAAQIDVASRGGIT